MTYHQYPHILENSIIDDETGELIEFIHLIKRDKYKNTWVKYLANDLGCLAQGVVERVKGIETIFFLAHG